MLRLFHSQSFIFPQVFSHTSYKFWTGRCIPCCFLRFSLRVATHRGHRRIRAESVGSLIQLDCLVVNVSQVSAAGRRCFLSCHGDEKRGFMAT